MAEFNVNYSNSANGWNVTIYWECEYGDTTADAWWVVNQNSYSRTFQIVSRADTSDRYDNYCTLSVGSEYYLYVYRNGSYSQQAGPFKITAPDPPTYTITYNANGGTGAPSSQTKTHGVSITLRTTKPTKSNASAGSYTVTLDANEGDCSTKSLTAARTTSYTFSKWNTKSGGTGTSYNPGQTYSTNGDLYLYAIYSSSTTTDSVELPTPTRSGYEFLGWAESATAESGTTGSLTPTKDITLYAIWKAKGLIYIYDGTEFAAFQVFIYNGSSWDLYCPYVYDGSSWSMCA